MSVAVRLPEVAVTPLAETSLSSKNLGRLQGRTEGGNRIYTLKIAKIGLNNDTEYVANLANVNVNVNERFLFPRESCNIVTAAAP